MISWQVLVCTESTREALGLPRDVSQSVSGYAKLERSLMSGLPNEVDFALNVFLLLSSEGKYILRGMKGQHVIDCMLTCVGIGRCGESTSDSQLFFSVEFGICCSHFLLITNKLP